MHLAFLFGDVFYRKMVSRIFCTSDILVSTFYVSKAGVPSQPGIPEVLEGSKDSIQWGKAEDNGSRLLYYILEVRYVCKSALEATKS